MPSGTSPNASADATSLIVPSPPHAITSRAPRRTAAAASSRAWPTASVTNTSTGSPLRVDDVARELRPRARGVADATPPEIGLMMMAVDTEVKAEVRTQSAQNR